MFRPPSFINVGPYYSDYYFLRLYCIIIKRAGRKYGDAACSGIYNGGGGGGQQRATIVSFVLLYIIILYSRGITCDNYCSFIFFFLLLQKLKKCFLRIYATHPVDRPRALNRQKPSPVYTPV